MAKTTAAKREVKGFLQMFRSLEAVLEDASDIESQAGAMKREIEGLKKERDKEQSELKKIQDSAKLAKSAVDKEYELRRNEAENALSRIKAQDVAYQQSVKDAQAEVERCQKAAKDAIYKAREEADKIREQAKGDATMIERDAKVKASNHRATIAELEQKQAAVQNDIDDAEKKLGNVRAEIDRLKSAFA